jgi:SrtB family sortase
MLKNKRKVLIIILIAITLVAGAFFAYFAHEAYVRLRDERAAQETARMMEELFQPPPPMEDVQIQEEVDLSPFLELIAALDDARELTGNDDITAYIYIHGTSINYVVLQGTDNSFYLSHDIFRNSNAAGSIFLDYLNSPDFTDPNTIIYGHNMRNDTMFSGLRDYVFGDSVESFFEEHPNVIIITDNEVLVYEIFSVFYTHIEFYFIQVDFADGEFAEFVEELSSRSFYDTGVIATDEDNVLLLSTCTNFDRDTRIVIASRLAQRLAIEQSEN